MRAAVLEEYGEPLEIEDVESPDSAPDGAVVEVETCGVCRSGWHGWRGDWEWVGAKLPRDRCSATSRPDASSRPARRSGDAGVDERLRHRRYPGL